MRLASIVFFLNMSAIAALLGLCFSSLRGPLQPEAPAIPASAETFNINQPSLRLMMGRDEVTLRGSQATMDPGADPRVLFNHDVQLDYGSHQIKPASLEYSFARQEITSKGLGMAGPPVVWVETAQLSSTHSASEFDDLVIVGDFPLKPGRKIREVRARHLRGQMRSLQHFQRHKSRQEGSSAASGNIDTAPREIPAFTLKAGHAIAPITSFSVRLKLQDLSFETRHVSISSKSGKYQSGRPLLTFMEGVAITRDKKTIECDQVTLNLETGALRYSSEGEFSISDD